MTIKEIAKLSGVAVSTVSRYLNNGYVSEEKREIIAKVIKENNYTPSEAASNLRGKSKEIVVIIQRITSPTTARLLEGIIKACDKKSLTVTILVVNFDIELQKQYILSAINRKVLGIIVYSFTEDLDFNYNNLLVVGQHSNHHKSFYPDGKVVFNKLVSQVLKNNSKIKNVVISGIEIMDIEFINRVAGSVDACLTHKISHEVIEQDFDKISDFKLVKGCYYVCLTDAQAYGIINLANSQSLKVGEDIFVSGYGDYPTSKLLNLTTVDGNFEQVGSLAVSSIFKNLQDSYKIEIDYKYRTSTKYKGL